MNILLIGGSSDGTFVDVQEGIDRIYMHVKNSTNDFNMPFSIKTEEYSQTPLSVNEKRLPIFCTTDYMNINEMLIRLINNYRAPVQIAP